MVIDDQGRHYGNMGYPGSLYQTNLHSSPPFSDPWGSQSTAQPPAPVHPASVCKHDVPRSVPLSYPQMPVSAPPLATGSAYANSGFGGSDLLNLPHDMSRSNYVSDPSYQSPSHSHSTFTSSSYSPLNYSQNLQQQHQHLHQNQHPQQHDLRKLSDSYVFPSPSILTMSLLLPSADFCLTVMSTTPVQNLALANWMPPEACWP
jgi:hypothetical protein